jgi:hypothetical protein
MKTSVEFKKAITNILDNKNNFDRAFILEIIDNEVVIEILRHEITNAAEKSRNAMANINNNLTF